MVNEIERKFLIKRMPDLSNFESVIYERFYIFRNDIVEMRVQKKGEKYEIERKEMVNGLSAEKTKLVIFFKKPFLSNFARRNFSLPRESVKVGFPYF